MATFSTRQQPRATSAGTTAAIVVLLLVIVALVSGGLYYVAQSTTEMHTVTSDHVTTVIRPSPAHTTTRDSTATPPIDTPTPAPVQ